VQIEGEALIRWDTADGSEPPLRPQGEVLNTPAGAGGAPHGISADGHIAVLRDFIQAIRTGGRPIADGAQGRRSIAAILGIYRAAGIH
jgi:predicted dehydrogenase